MASTLKRFWDDPYLCVLDTSIAAIDGAQVELAQTIFYAESGGQESDAGTIGGIAVLDARKRERGIVYTLAQTPAWRVGDAVRVEIDWARRYRLMRLHFAAEVVLELAYRTWPSIEKIGAHIGPDKARIDFAWQESIASALPGLQAQVASMIAANAPIVSAYADEASERRYWEVEGFARVPCGGTHLRRTAEVGAVTLKRKNVGRGKERIEIALA